MALRSLSDNYDRICQLLETAVDKREGLFNYKDGQYTFDQRRNWKALVDYDRDITYAITLLIRTDRQFRSACGDRVFSSNQVMKLVLAEKLIPPETVRYLAHIEEQLITHVRDDAGDIKRLRQLLRQQLNAKSAADIVRLEENIHSVGQQLFKKAAPYQELQTFAHQQVPGTLREQEITNPTRFAPQDTNGASLWELVKFAAEIEIFLNTIMGLVTNQGATKAGSITNPPRQITGDVDICNDLPEAVAFACTPGYTLQSAADAVLRLCHDEPTRSGIQLTRTLAICFTVNQKRYIAFDDAPENDTLLHAAMTKHPPNSTPWFFSMKPSVNPVLARAVARARHNNRVVDGFDGNLTVSIDFVERGALQAIIGAEASPAFAQWLHKIGRDAAIWGVHKKEWEQIATDPWTAGLHVITVDESQIRFSCWQQGGVTVRIPMPRE
jgi:hypothetical protein